MIFNLAFYAEIRSTDGSQFHNWALACLFFGQPLGASIAGYIIKRTQKVVGLILVNAILSLVLYTSLATGWIRKSHVEKRNEILLSEESLGPEDARYAPLLVAFGFNLGVSLSGLMVALLCIVKKEGRYEPNGTPLCH